MKVLWIGNPLDGTGWSQACINYVLSLDSVGVDVVLRSIKLNNNTVKVPQRIKELLAKDSKGCDICVQQVLPHMMDYNGRFKKNIGLLFSEMSNFSNNIWVDKLNLMNEVWVPSDSCIRDCCESGVNSTIRKIQHPHDISKYSQSYEPFSLGSGFKFYFIGEFNRRKNISALIKAFNIAFSRDDDVELIIKTNVSPDVFNKFSTEIKSGLRLYDSINKYKQEILINEYFTDEEIMRLHASCDCFVMPSYGEGWNIPAFDAMAMGKTPIVTEGTGMDEYISNKFTGFTVRSIDEASFGMMDSLPLLHTAVERCKSVSTLTLAKTMRLVYEYKTLREQVSNQGIDYAMNFTYEFIGNRIKKILED